MIKIPIKKIEPVREYNLYIRRNRTPNKYETLPPFPSLKSISTHYISSFFITKTAHQIEELEIPEALKRDVKELCISKFSY